MDSKGSVIDELLMRLDNIRSDLNESTRKLNKCIKDIEVALYGETQDSDSDEEDIPMHSYTPSMKVQLRWTRAEPSDLSDVHAESPRWRCTEHGVCWSGLGACPTCFMEDQEDKYGISRAPPPASSSGSH